MTAYDDDGEVTVLSNFPNGEKIGPALVSGGRRRKCPRGRRRENWIGDHKYWKSFEEKNVYYLIEPLLASLLNFILIVAWKGLQ